MNLVCVKYKTMGYNIAVLNSEDGDVITRVFNCPIETRGGFLLLKPFHNSYKYLKHIVTDSIK